MQSSIEGSPPPPPPPLGVDALRVLLAGLEATAPSHPAFLALARLLGEPSPRPHDLAGWSVACGRSAAAAAVAAALVSALASSEPLPRVVAPEFPPRDASTTEGPATWPAGRLLDILWRGLHPGGARRAFVPLPPRPLPPSPPPSPPPPAAAAGASLAMAAATAAMSAASGRRQWARAPQAPQPLDLTATQLAREDAERAAAPAAQPHAQPYIPAPVVLPPAPVFHLQPVPVRPAAPAVEEPAPMPPPAPAQTAQPVKPRAHLMQPPAPLPPASMFASSAATAARGYFPPAFVPQPRNFRRIALAEDVQAVRSVAFHPSGQFVAVGANSATLRIASLRVLDSPAICVQRRNHHRFGRRPLSPECANFCFCFVMIQRLNLLHCMERCRHIARVGLE